ncbi:sigma-70 region 4 domain-containing protein [Nocardioides sp.]|uniref:RNA polymerase sigma factor n=1 Tax=Nocardioides sp. TaxID=35761 RepID=UPI001A25AF8F|nr:sigma-70 region 4 domain-containing protein [Nocardioides sp.]MBJ7358665.1 sigma-70 region 4 domain-containing protein [Nocardioides sp.]
MELTTHAPVVSGARSLRSVGSGSRQAAAWNLWDRHSGSAYSLACALLGSHAAAADAVALAMADLARSGEESDDQARRVLARSIYCHGAVPAAAVSDTERLPRPMVWLSRLARLQRASLALCVYGGLTHREAAELLDVAPATVADLLTAGLKELGVLAAADAATCA